MSETLAPYAASAALSYMRGNQGLVYPHNAHPGSRRGGDTSFENREQWDAYQWNPPEYLVHRYPDIDPTASPKPTWDEIVDASAMYNIVIPAQRLTHYIGNFADPIASAPVLHEDTGQNIQFKSIDSLTGLVHLHVKHSQEGETFEEVHFPSADNPKTTVALTTLAQLEGFLTAIATNKNRAESARNCVSAQLHLLLEQIQTDGIADAERERLAGEITAITDDPGAAILAKVEDMYGAPPTIP